MSMIVRLGTQRLRRDRLELPLWLVGGALLAMSGASAVASSYGDHAERAALLKTVAANPVILLFRGLPSGPGEAEFVLFLLLPWLVLVAALMSVFLAVRHTRADEESGRAALIAATRAGTRGPLTATLAYGVLINAVFGVLVMAVYLASGYPLPGSLIAGAACAISGAAFLTIALLAAQVARTSRGATSTGVWLALIALLVSGIGNALGQPDATLMRREPSWVTWLSPVGWAELTRPFADNDWRPLLLSAALAIAAGAGAYALNAKRDLEEGLWPQKHGRAEAGAMLRSHPTLVWRLSRGSILGWAAGALITGMLASSLSGVIRQASGEVPAVRTLLEAIGGGAQVDRALVLIFYVLIGVLAACAGIQTMLRARQEESHGTAEIVWSTPITRVRWLGGFIAVAVIAALFTLAAAIAGSALGLASAAGAATGSTDGAGLWQASYLAATVQGAAAAVLIAFGALAVALVPRAAIALSWLGMVVTLSLGLFGPLFQFPDWLVHLSPFALAVPGLAGSSGSWGPVWLLVVGAAAGCALALWRMRGRELASE